MSNKIGLQFVALTFAMTLGLCGIILAFGMFGFTLENAPWLIVFAIIGGLSPTITSYIALKRSKKVSDFKEWIGNVFAVRSSLRFYLLVIILVVVSEVPQVIFTGFGEAKPFYMFFVLLPLCLIGGGLEEAGWSYVLRPELEKKFEYVFSSVIVAVIWVVWHIPGYLLLGTIESLSWLGLFAIACLGQSFALGAIIKITKNVWLCVLYHTLLNAVSTTIYEYSDSLIGNLFSTGLLIVISVMAVFIYEKKSRIA